MIALLALLPALGLQAPEAPDPARLSADHRRTVESERTAALLEAWMDADEDVRAKVAARIDDARPRGAALAAKPALAELIGALHELTGGALVGPVPLPRLGEQQRLQAFADSLDLTLQPGAFAARAQGRGEALTVHVSALFRPQLWGDVFLALVWIGPDGREIVARREPATVEVLLDGVPLFIRPPESEPSVWTLAAQVELQDLVARGLGTRVECLPDLQARTARALVAPEEESAGDARLRHGLRLLMEHGVRLQVALAPGRALALLEGSGEAEWPRPVERAFVEPDGREGWIWALRPAGPLERVIVMVAPGAELPDLALSGTLGERWARTAAAQRALLFAVELPSAAADRAPAELFERLGELARAAGVPEDGERILVGRGAAALRLTFSVPRDTYHAAVLSTVVPADDARAFLAGVPRLVVAPGGSAGAPDPSETPGELVWVEGAPTPLFNEPRLPALVDAWLAARGGAR
jgi:hypothetical protein